MSPRRERRPPIGKEIRAKLSLDSASLNQFVAVLGQLREAVRAEIVKKALLAGGGVTQAAIKRRAPGPYIEVEFMQGRQLNTGRAAGGIKKEIKSDGLYVVVGPDKAHWYYRFSEYGSKLHGARTKYTQRDRKRLHEANTRYRGDRYKEIRRSIRKAVHSQRGKAMMTWKSGGKQIFARQVRGIAARPFMRPGVDESEAAAMKAIAVVLAAEIRKALAK